VGTRCEVLRVGGEPGTDVACERERGENEGREEGRAHRPPETRGGSGAYSRPARRSASRWQEPESVEARSPA
jgi:hypothetical protein